MGLNTGYLNAARTEESNENYTPYYAVDPILKYIPDEAVVWTPFDRDWSAFYQSFMARGGSGPYGRTYRTGLIFLPTSLRIMTVLFPIRLLRRKTG